MVAENLGVADSCWSYVPRGDVGRFRRLPSVDRESQLDFYTGHRQWVYRKLMPAGRIRAEEIARANGVSPLDLTPLAAARMMEADPILALNSHAWQTSQLCMWDLIQTELHAHAEEYLAELAAAESKGPGRLILDPGLEIPDYARHEIHLQPGGYIADPLAGYVLYHGHNVVYPGGNFQDEYHLDAAMGVPIPADGKVNRILEQGCGPGQMMLPLKERFPDSEVWGDDVSAPMLRFAHMRSVSFDLDTRYVQQMSERSRFDDGYFDVVTSYLQFHEVPIAAAHAIIAEAFRQLRPGGIYYPVDLLTHDRKTESTAFHKYSAWRDFRWNGEVWRPDYESLDMKSALREAGFDVSMSSSGSFPGSKANILATKPG
jgi:ubiquinone/menaquinone biosynthesis C-methylase UbiE